MKDGNEREVERSTSRRTSEEEEEVGERGILLEVPQGSPMAMCWLSHESIIQDKILDLLANVRVPGRPPEPLRH